MIFKKEADFEEAVIKLLLQSGWKEVIKNPTEEDLIQNWANIIFENNRGIDRLNDYPLTQGEMQQILEQIQDLRTPLKLNEFIKGKSVSIIRDNPEDELHFGLAVQVTIFDPRQIGGGQSEYQIVQQPRFPAKSKLLNDRRGDLMLLISGIPLIHIELKRSGVPVSQAFHQIEKYGREGVFTGLFSMIQIFVAMEPEEAVYFANPGPDGRFNSDYYFHWADVNNEPINQWNRVVRTLLSIPMAHQLVGLYTIADETESVLKVMRSYQYFASTKISDKVAETKWEEKNQRGGYIWHTTGSGKTMTSFKSAQLIADSKDADKVIFLMDRIELGTQSLREYQGFEGKKEDIQGTENTGILITKLKSAKPTDILIVTSIQKMSNIKEEEDGLKSADIEVIGKKRLVFIVDEAHRSTFGEMLSTIKKTFPKAIFFGFTGTPIQEENKKKKSVTSTIFGDELHRYSIADGIRDKNVLGFDPYKVLTFKDREVRRSVALRMANARTEEEVERQPEKKKIYDKYMDASRVGMAGKILASGEYEKGIEDHIPREQYQTKEHVNMVVKDLLENWTTLSRNGKFHGILATSSIPEAIVYYRKIKEEKPELNITALFDPNIDNQGNSNSKADGLVEIIQDYNQRYGQDFTLPTFSKMKKDIAARLSHKKPYESIGNEPEKQLNLLIVVDQMLTGFDSKWINTLYLDKLLTYEHLIQGFSRTNRLFGPEKPFGTIRYYRKPHTMERNIQNAVKLYSGDKPLGLFVPQLEENLKKLNQCFQEISDLFIKSGVMNFEKLPEEIPVRRKFGKEMNRLQGYLEAAKVQGFQWKEKTYLDDAGEEKIEILFGEREYLILIQRYKELEKLGSREKEEVATYDLVGYITEIDTGFIDAEYMNSRFEKYMRLLEKEGAKAESAKAAEEELHKTFATLTQEEQKYANIFLHDMERGDAILKEGKTFREYINDYLYKAKADEVTQIVEALGVDEEKLRSLMELKPQEKNLNEFGRYDELIKTVDKKKAKEYFEREEGVALIPPKVNVKADQLLRSFILRGGFEIGRKEKNDREREDV